MLYCAELIQMQKCKHVYYEPMTQERNIMHM